MWVLHKPVDYDRLINVVCDLIESSSFQCGRTSGRLAPELAKSAE